VSTSVPDVHARMQAPSALAKPLSAFRSRKPSVTTDSDITTLQFAEPPTTSGLEQHIKTWHLHPLQKVNLDSNSALSPIRQPRRHNGTSALPRTQTCPNSHIFIVGLFSILRCGNQYRLRPLRCRHWCCHDLANSQSLAYLAW